MSVNQVLAAYVIKQTRSIMSVYALNNCIPLFIVLCVIYSVYFSFKYKLVAFLFELGKFYFILLLILQLI